MDENTIDLRELLDIILNNIRKIAKITLACIAIAVLYLLIASPVYESQSLLRIKQQQGLGDSLLATVTGGNTQVTQQRMSTYAEILKSRGVVIPVIEATEEQDKDGKFPAYAGYVKSRITTVPFKNTEILQVSVNAKTPELAQKANSLLVEGFLNRLTDLSHTEAKATREFLTKRTDDAKGEVTKAEAALQKYKAKHRIADPVEGAKSYVTRAADIDKLKAENQLNLETAQAKLAAVDGQLGGEGRGTADNATIQKYNGQLAELEATKIGYQDKYTAKHPKMVEINDQIASLKRKIRAEINKVATLQAPSDNAVHQGLIAGKFQSEGEIAVAQKRGAALQTLEDKLNKDLEKLSKVEQGYVQVARDANVASELYVMLAKRLEEAKIAEVMVTNDVQVIDTATLPERPIKPRKALTLVLAALLGVLLGSGLVVAGELLNKKAKTEEDITNYLQLPILGVVPDANSLAKAMSKDKQNIGIVGKLRRLLWRR